MVNSDTILPSQMLVTSSLGLYLSKLPALFISTRSLALYHYCHLLCNSGMITHSFWNLHLLFLSGNVLSSALDKATSYLTPYENLGVSSPPLGNISSNLISSLCVTPTSGLASTHRLENLTNPLRAWTGDAGGLPVAGPPEAGSLGITSVRPVNCGANTTLSREKACTYISAVVVRPAPTWARPHSPKRPVSILSDSTAIAPWVVSTPWLVSVFPVKFAYIFPPSFKRLT